MLVINARNVNGALAHGLAVIQSQGEYRESRVGRTLEINSPVATVYARPWERVLIDSVRDCNHFFHLFEALWILAGREDVAFLTQFNSRMSDYSDDGVTFNAAYGFRMKLRFGFDQILTAIEELRGDTDTRQAVIQIWDPEDLGKITKDKACNMQVVFRVRERGGVDQLDMTVYNRSNDIIWGAYGANMVQFSMLMEYVAAALNMPLGQYTHVSNSFHVYVTGPGGDKFNELIGLDPDKDAYNLLKKDPYNEVYHQEYITEFDEFNDDLRHLFDMYDNGQDLYEISVQEFSSQFFRNVVAPMALTWFKHKMGDTNAGVYSALASITSDDWRYGCTDWINNRRG